MKRKVYIETSIVSYYTARPSRDLVAAAWEEDALHIAVAALNGMEFLLTWNFSHINDAFKKFKIVTEIENLGLIPPEICSPEEFMGD